MSNAPYRRAHARARLKYGPAGYNPCEFCGLTAEDYALDWTAPDIQRDDKGRAYSDDPDWYLILCRRCHREYDRGGKRLDAEGLLRLRIRRWAAVTDEARGVQRKARESAQDAFLRHKFKLADVIRRRTRVMEECP